MKRLSVVSLGLFLVLAVTGTLWSQGVLKTGMDSPLQIVKTRKYLMHTVRLNFEDGAKKFEAGVMEAMGALQQSCGTCHNAYRGSF
jgi:cytochrome c553